MATWVNWAKARRFPAVLNKYKTNNQFKVAVAAEIAGSAAWARYVPGGATIPKCRSNWQVDVTAVPLVRPMFPGGSLKS